MDSKPRNNNWLFVLVVVGLIFVYFNRNEPWVQSIFGRAQQPQNAAPTAMTTLYPVPSPAPSENAPGGDYFGDYMKTAVPTEARWHVNVAELFNLDQVKLNQYFDQSVYKDSNVAVLIGTYARPRAAKMATALIWPTNMFTKLVGVDGEVLSGTELATITTADVFLSLGTTPGQALDGITDIRVNGNTISITSEIPMKALLIGIPLSEKDNNPQVEHSTVATPSPLLNAWLGFSQRLPSESDLNNLGLRQASAEALYLLLHTDGERMREDFTLSVETPGEGHAYDTLSAYIKDSFCKKLDSYQTQMEQSGTKIDRVTCDQMVIEVTLKAIPPRDPQGNTDMAYLTMLRSGAFVQVPGLIQLTP